jgi:hypothetical protein
MTDVWSAPYVCLGTLERVLLKTYMCTRMKYDRIQQQLFHQAPFEPCANRVGVRDVCGVRVCVCVLREVFCFTTTHRKTSDDIGWQHEHKCILGTDNYSEMDEMTVLLPHGSSAPLGISCNNRLIIRELDTMSVADKVLRVGDRVLAVDDTPVNTLDEMAMRIAHNHKSIIVLRVQLRGMHRATPAHGDSGDRIRIALTWLRHGPKLGMAIKQVRV